MSYKKDKEKIYNFLKNNLKLLDRVEESTDEEKELILLIVIHELRKMTSEIIEEWQIADSWKVIKIEASMDPIYVCYSDRIWYIYFYRWTMV